MGGRVCLDGRSLGLAQGTGVASYAARLAADLPGAGWTVDVLLPGTEDGGRAGRRLRAAWPGASHAAPTPPPKGFDRAWLAPDVFRRAQVFFDIHHRPLPIAAAAPPALMHWTYPLPMRMRGARNVYTVYDLIPLLRPDLTPIEGRRFGRILRHVTEDAAHIVTISETARADIQRLLGVPPDRVTNTFVPVDVSGAAAPGPVRGHFLFCGSIEPRKNVARLLRAHAASGTTTPLVLAGPDGWRAAEELAAGGVAVRPLAAMQPQPAGGVWRAPWLPRPALLALMRDARAVLFPSLAEGFGLPIAEAMALRVPVMTSGGGATEEIAGGAALLVDPLDTGDMARAITALDGDADLRGRLITAGTIRAGLFAPATCMGRLTAVYAAALRR